MLKGLCALLTLAVVLAAPHQLQAQVYRCESDSGVTYSDMPCGASAEEVVVAGDVLDMRGVGAAEPVEPVDEAVTAGAGAQPPTPDQSGQPAAGNGQDLNGFLVMLRSQRQQQIGQIDSQLTQLRQQARSAEFLDKEITEQDQLNSRIAQLESDRASILSEYDALIAEAQRRVD